MLEVVYNVRVYTLVIKKKKIIFNKYVLQYVWKKDANVNEQDKPNRPVIDLGRNIGQL